MLNHYRATIGALVSALALSLFAFATPPAHAASVGTITVTSLSALSPTSLAAAVGDEFTVANSAGTSIMVSQVAANGDTGAISLAVSPSTHCVDFTQATCSLPSGSQSYVIDGLGTISITYQSSGSWIRIGTVTLGSTRPSSPTTPNTSDVTEKFTTTAVANGGTCTGPTSWMRINGNSTFNGVFTLPDGTACTRPGYTLFGWSTDEMGRSVQWWEPGETFRMDQSNYTLYAIWRPDGIEVTYDANVGLNGQCLKDGVNVDTPEGRRTEPVVVAVGSNSAQAAPCTPPGYELVGWMPAGDTDSELTTGTSETSQVVARGVAFPSVYVRGSAYTVYAKWRLIPTTKSIEITNWGRTRVSGQPGVYASGTVSGFAPDAKLKVWVKFPGNIYALETSRAVIDANGRYEWSRKTGKKVSVYFTSDDERVTSIRVVIPAP